MTDVFRIPERVGNLTKNQTNRAANFTSVIARFIAQRATGDAQVGNLVSTETYGFEAERVITTQHGDLTIETIIRVRQT